jgi:hypothetical protein
MKAIMRRLLTVIFIMLSLAASGRATFSLVQKPSSSCSGCSTATLTLTQATGTGNLLILVVGGTNGTSGDISTGTPPGSGGTWVIGTTCHTTNGTVFGLSSCAWVLSSTGGVTSIFITFTATNTYRYGLLEYHYTGSSVAFDVAGTSVHTSNTTSQVGPTLSLTGTNDVIINGVVMTVTSTITSISSPYTQPPDISDTGSSQALGASSVLNSTTGTGPTWTTGSSSSICFALAFKETGGGATPKKPPVVI